MTTPDLVVLRFGQRRVPRGLAGVPVVAVDGPRTVDGVLTDGVGRLAVLGADGDLAVVLSRLLRLERLDVEVAYLARRRTHATRVHGLPTGARAARAARTGTATRLPLIRDDAGIALVGAGSWIGDDGRLRGEAVVDDTVLFDGEVAKVLVEPTGAMPGVRAAVSAGRLRPRRWVTGRAAQLGTTGAIVVRDGEPSARAVKRSTFYRHTQGWLAVR